MIHELPPLPYAKDALAPYISEETVEYHYGKHHQTYVNNLNNLTMGTEFISMPLDEIVKSSDGAIFNNAAQVWNHNFYWNCLSPDGGGRPTGALLDVIEESFNTYDTMKREFNRVAMATFGSGWAWIVKKDDGLLEFASTSNAGCPITEGKTPILTCDVWEHAYYVDYRNARQKYLDAFWNIVNWDFVAKNLGL